MDYGVCILSVVPLRGEASERSEMVSQLLFGDTYEILEIADNWLKIKTTDCDYEGWLNVKYHLPLTNQQFADIQLVEKFVTRDIVTQVTELGKQQSFPVFMGSSLPFPDAEHRFCLGNAQFDLSTIPTRQPNFAGLQERQTAMLQFAMSFLRTPYLWGGRTPAGIDCSGFTQLIYKSIGVSIPRDASQQVDLGTVLDFVSEAAVGDLAFFQNAEGRIVHVGMVCAPGKIIHASGQVRIDTLDETGIYNADKGQYSHSLRVVKRLLV